MLDVAKLMKNKTTADEIGDVVNLVRAELSKTRDELAALQDASRSLLLEAGATTLDSHYQKIGRLQGDIDRLSLALPEIETRQNQAADDERLTVVRKRVEEARCLQKEGIELITQVYATAADQIAQALARVAEIEIVIERANRSAEFYNTGDRVESVDRAARPELCARLNQGIRSDKRPVTKAIRLPSLDGDKYIWPKDIRMGS